MTICDSLLEPVPQPTHNPERSERQASTPLVGLASKSPRRRLLLTEAGVRHVVVESGVDDAQLSPGAVSPEAWVAALAYLKAAAGLRNDPSGGTGAAGGVGGSAPEVLLGADTVVVHRGEIIGQPRDAADAERIVRRLAADEHDVVTGVALIDPRTGGRDLLVDRARVWVGPLSDEQVMTYVESGQWRGKAGAYNLSERLAAGWPIRYEGDPGTIMGLPMATLLPRLRRFA